MISIVIPTRNRLDLLMQCVESIRTHCVWTGGDRPSGLTRQVFHYEIIPVDTGDGMEADWVEENRPRTRSIPSYLDRAIPLPGGTFAQACNKGVKRSSADQILLLNNDCLLTNDLLQAFRIAALGHEADRIIGARLLYPDGLVQHAGVGFDTDGCPYNLWRYAPAEHPEVMKPHILPAVTFACALIPRKVWEELGGLDERFVNSFEDVDFCLRAREAGYTVAYDPHVSCIHLEGQTEGRNDGIDDSWHVFQEKWHADASIHQALGMWPFSLERGK